MQASADAYVLNLNRNVAYKDFRKAREAREAKKEKFFWDGSCYNYDQLFAIRERVYTLVTRYNKKK